MSSTDNRQKATVGEQNTPLELAEKSVAWLRQIAPSGLINIVTASREFSEIETRSFSDDAEMAAFIARQGSAERGTYWQVNECSAAADGNGTRPTKSHVGLIRVLHLDYDFKDIDPNGLMTPEYVEQLKDQLLTRLIEPKGIPAPTFVVSSGGGFHAYWVLEQPLEATPENIALAESINADIATRFGADPSTRDVSRLLRVPYTTNFVKASKRANGRVDGKVAVLWREGDLVSTADFPAPKAELPLGRATHQHEAKPPVVLGGDGLHELNLEVEKHADTLALICWTPEVVAAGWRLDNPDKQYLLQPTKRSERVKSVVERLILAKIPSEIIVGVITDERWPVSAHVLDNGGLAYAWRQLRDHKPEELVHEPELVSLTPIPDDLPPPKTLVEGLLIDGTLTVLGGRGGVGKSLLQIHVAVGVALGLPTLHWPAPKEPRRVLMLNSEDDQREKQHRLWAVCQQMGVNSAELDGKLFTMTQARIELMEATFDNTGKREVKPTPFFDRLKVLIKSQNIGLLVVDPMAELHVGLDENSNMDMKELMIALRIAAVQLAIPIMIAHHTRKGYAADGQEQDAFRGAGAIINAARTAILMEALKKEEADAIVGKNDKRENFVVVADAKQNYFSKEGARMLKFVAHQHPSAGWRAAFSVPNMESLPPNAPPEALEQTEQILDLLRERRDTGNRPFYTSAKTKKDGRLDAAIMEVIGLSKNDTAAAITILERAGLIVRTKWRNDKREAVEVWRLGKEDAGFEYEDVPF